MTERTPLVSSTVAIVSCDVLGHSNATMVDQLRRVSAINHIIGQTIEASAPGSVVWSSGGDGGHVILRMSGWCATAEQLAIKLWRWAREADVRMRITAHYGDIYLITGADGRVQPVGDAINFAGWLLDTVEDDGIVVTDAFRRAASSTTAFRFHDERLVLRANSMPELLYLASAHPVTSCWVDDPSPHDHAMFDELIAAGDGWGALHYAKRIWQADSGYEQIRDQLDHITNLLRQATWSDRNFFCMLRPDELAEVLRHGQLMERNRGSIICRYKDPGDSLFVILKGEVGVYNLEGKGFRGAAAPKHVHHAGDVVGELAYALGRTRTADLVALTDVALLAVNSKDITERLRKTTTGEMAARQLETFTVARALEHTSQVAPYLLGPSRTGPLSSSSGPHDQSDADRPWQATLRYLANHCRLLSPPTSSSLDLTIFDVTGEECTTGLFILVTGRVLHPRTGEVLRGEECPVLWVDLPDLLRHPPVTYRKYTDRIKVMHISNEGIEQLTVHQRERLVRMLPEAVGTTPQYEYDVYLCYAGADRTIVTGVRDKLAESGVTVWFDDEELRPNTTVLREMERGLTSSRYLLVCVGKNFPHSRWAQHETDAAFYLRREGSDPDVIVLVLEDATDEEDLIPLFLRRMKRYYYSKPGDLERIIEFLSTAR